MIESPFRDVSMTSCVVVCSLGADGGVFQENEAKHKGYS